MKKIKFPPYEPISVKGDLRDIILDAADFAFKRGYQKGYRAAKAKPMWTGLEKASYQKGYRAGRQYDLRKGYGYLLGDLGIRQTGIKKGGEIK
jgi:hypothetical protein